MEVGDEVGGWRIEERLGVGGAADVYRCRQGDREAAIKLLRSVDEGSQQHRRLRREADILLRLSHPNIVKVQAVVLACPAYIEMQFVRGRHAGFLVRSGAAAPATLRALATQLLSAMAYWHRMGVAHRDVKPGNLLVGPDGKLTVVDFNLALDESAERLSGLGVRVGTYVYAPPEWISDQPCDPKAWDVYGAGQVLWELAEGRRAFDTKAAVPTIMRLKLAAERLDPGRHVPEDLRVLIRAMTETDPARRLPDGPAALAMLGSG